jgi:cell division protein FtsL
MLSKVKLPILFQGTADVKKDSFTPTKLFFVLFFALVASSLTVTAIYIGVTAYAAKIAVEEIKKEQARIKELASFQLQADRDRLEKERARIALENAKREKERSIKSKNLIQETKKKKAILNQLRETCTFWTTTYRKERTEYSRLMKNDACGKLK